MEYPTRLYFIDGYEPQTLFRGCKFLIKLKKCKYNRTIQHDKHDREIVISASSMTSIEKAVRLLLACYTLQNSCLPPFSHDQHIPSYRKLFGIKLDPESAFSGVENLCKLCCKASYFTKIKWAIHKYHLACQIHSNEIVDLNPREGHIQISPYDDDKIRYAYCIVIFYSVIEELGLEIRGASKDKPSIINGKWNVDILNNLQQRLLKIGISNRDNISWIRRSKPTKIEKRKSIPIQRKSEWAYGSIRDSEILIPDAIATVSMLRSKISSHKLNGLFRSFSVYDVANANHLCRELLLSSINKKRST